MSIIIDIYDSCIINVSQWQKGFLPSRPSPKTCLLSNPPYPLVVVLAAINHINGIFLCKQDKTNK